MLTMYKQITIHTLHKQGIRQSVIAEQLGCHRHTIANVLKREQFIEKQTRQKGSMFDPYASWIKEWIKRDISILRMYEMLTEAYGIHSTYVNLCKYIQVRFPKQPEAFGVQITEPGEVAEIDFGYLGMFQNPMGTVVKTYGLCVVLHYSRLGFYAITYDQKLETLIKELENALLYFGGVPKKLKVDNMKTAILKNQHYDLDFNQDFLEFAYHYNTVIVPCSPYSPEQKGTVESGIKYLQGNFLPGREFSASSDMKTQLKDWMENYANRRIHGTTRKVPYVEFLQVEKDALQPLPENDFAFFNRCTRIVAPNCHVHLENNYYSIPSIFVGKEVTVRWNSNLVRIVQGGEQVALHQKALGIGTYVTRRSHLPDYKVYSQTEYQKRHEEQMADIGSSAHEYFCFLLAAKESYWFRSVRAILGFAKEYGNEAVNLTLKRAMYYKVTDLTTIKNILERKLYLVTEEPRLLHGSPLQASCPMEPPLCRELTYYTQNEGSVS